MIAKRSIRRNGGRFKKLADYITRKGREIWTENCSDDLEIALAHIEAVQSLNTRTRLDKTYHLIVSFPEGERPGTETLKDIERTLADRLGYTEHHRLVALHTDTSHLHLHVAISKIHPETLKAVEPFFDYRKLAEGCRTLEIKHNLKRLDPAQSVARKSAIEQRQGLVSFESWLKENVQKPMKNIMEGSEGWERLHRELARFDVSLRKHGSGLVFSHRSAKIFCKVSQIDRDFSLGKLEKRFGPFQDCKGKYAAEQSYRPVPMNASPATRALFDTFTLERDQKREKRAESMKIFQDEKIKAREEILTRYRKRRLEVRLDRVLRPEQKQRIYETLFEKMKKELAKDREANVRKRKAVSEKTRIPRWREWLQEKAQGGNAQALAALRIGRKTEQQLPNQIRLQKPSDLVYTEFPRSVSAEGVLTYRMSHGALLDCGQHLYILGSSPEHIREAMTFIVKKFGDHLQISGHQDFKDLAKVFLKEHRRQTQPKKDRSLDLGL